MRGHVGDLAVDLDADDARESVLSAIEHVAAAAYADDGPGAAVAQLRTEGRYVITQEWQSGEVALEAHHLRPGEVVDVEIHGIDWLKSRHVRAGSPHQGVHGFGIAEANLGDRVPNFCIDIVAQINVSFGPNWLNAAHGRGIEGGDHHEGDGS